MYHTIDCKVDMNSTIKRGPMEKQAIIQKLNEIHQKLFSWLNAQDPIHWEKGPDGKWTTGQQVKHLDQSLSQLNRALKIPKFILRWRIGVSNREVRTYDEVVNRYNDRLNANPGVVAPAARNMTVPKTEERLALIAHLKKEKDKLIRSVHKWSDHDLDRHILPHPLMGRMPVREIIMWTAYHTEHHLKQLTEKY